MFVYNSSKKSFNKSKSYSLPNHVNRRDIEHTVIKKANHFFSFNFGDKQLLIIIFFFVGEIVFDSFLKAYKLQKQKISSPTNGLINLTNCKKQNFPRMTNFRVDVIVLTFLKPNTRTVFFWKRGITTEQAVVKLKCQSNKRQELRTINAYNIYGSSKRRANFKISCAGLRKKMLFLILQAMQKRNDLYDDNDIDIIMLGCNVPNLAKFFLHKSTDTKF